MAKLKLENMTFITASKCKFYLKHGRELRCSADALETLNNKVRQLLNLAADAAEADKRATVKARDITL